MNDKKQIDFVPITPEFLESVEKDYVQSGVINPDLHKTVKSSDPEFNIKEDRRIDKLIAKNIKRIREQNEENDSPNEISKKPK